MVRKAGCVLDAASDRFEVDGRVGDETAVLDRYALIARVSKDCSVHYWCSTLQGPHVL